MSGTDMPMLVSCYAFAMQPLLRQTIAGADIAYAAMPLPCNTRYLPTTLLSIGLRDCYAMPGTDLAYGTTRPRAYGSTASRQRFQRSDTLAAYAHATQCPVLTECTALSTYARAMRCPVLTYCMLLPASTTQRAFALLRPQPRILLRDLLGSTVTSSLLAVTASLIDTETQ
eukprot:171685-Rhodomonas_salina.1